MTSEHSDPALGRTIKETYQIESKLGEGGPSIVYKGRDLLMDIPIAIKMLKQADGVGLGDTKRFLREARTQAQLVHRNIVTIRSIIEEEGEFYIVMEFIDGTTLEDLISEGNSLPMVPLETFTELASQTLDGLGFAHQKGVLHRDIKPANIMVTHDQVAKLADFGIARQVNDNRLTRTGAVLGTPPYMSPEQIRGQELDHRTDIYSFGATLYEALSGFSPFEHPSFSKDGAGVDLYELMTRHIKEAPLSLRGLGLDIPPSLEAVINKSLAKSPDQRYQDCESFRVALRQSVGIDTVLLQSSPLPPQEEAPGAKRARPSPQESKGLHPMLLLALGGCLCLLLGLFFLFRQPAKKHALRADLRAKARADIRTGSPKQPVRQTPPHKQVRQPAPKTQQPLSSPPDRAPAPREGREPAAPIVPPDQPPALAPTQPSPVPAPDLAPAQPREPLAAKAPTNPQGSGDHPPSTVYRAKDMVEIKAGCFAQGEPSQGRRRSRYSPQRRVCLKGFWMDRYEVTVDDYKRCMQKGVCREIWYKFSWFQRAKPISQVIKAGHPMAYIRWREAQRFCKWAGKRLPTEAEWEKAARGAQKLLYPWGNQRPTCRHARYARCGRRTAPVGPSYRIQGQSPYKLFDMAGNVREWVFDCYDSKAYTKLNKGETTFVKAGCRKHTVRGGSLTTRRAEGLRTYYRIGGGRKRRYDQGFRCAWGP